MQIEIIILIFIPPVLTIIYRWSEHIGIIDKVTGRDLAKEGLKRLKSTSGYPESWIYNKDQDKEIFTQLEKRLSKKTSIPKMKQVIKQGNKPELITIAGSPIEIGGVPPEWPQKERFTYLPNQPILYIFDTTGSKTGKKGDKICTLEELETWLKEEKDSRLFWLGVVVLGIFSIALLVLRITNIN